LANLPLLFSVPSAFGVFSLCALSLAAVALPADERGSLAQAIKRIFSSRKNPKPTTALNAVATRPRVVTDNGWTTIFCEDADAFESWIGRDEEGFPSDPLEMPSLGSHLLIELYGCKSELLEREEHVGGAMRLAAVESEATVVEQSFHEFKPFGVSGAVIIQESHYTIHTWPEHRYAAVDLFYCGGGIRVHKAIDVLREQFQPERIKFLVVRRGLQCEVNHDC
jgi:S-adenosylmethionine decarboxylase